MVFINTYMDHGSGYIQFNLCKQQCFIILYFIGADKCYENLLVNPYSEIRKRINTVMYLFSPFLGSDYLLRE